MTNTQEAFEEWFDENRELYNTSSTYDLMQKTWHACQAHNDVVIAGLEEKRIMQLSAISTASIGYFKDGDDIHKDYDTVALRDVTNLYVRYTEQAQAIAELVEALIEVRKVIDDNLPTRLGQSSKDTIDELIAKHKKV